MPANVQTDLRSCGASDKVVLGCIPLRAPSSCSNQQWRDAHALVAPLLWLEYTRRARKAASRKATRNASRQASPSPYGSGRSLRDATPARSTQRPAAARPQPQASPSSGMSRPASLSLSHELCPRHLGTHVPGSLNWDYNSLRNRPPARSISRTSLDSCSEGGIIPSFRV